MSTGDIVITKVYFPEGSSLSSQVDKLRHTSYKVVGVPAKGYKERDAGHAAGVKDVLQ